MKLSVFERLILLNILPMEGDFLTIKIVHDLRTELAFTEEEHAALKFETLDTGDVRWVTGADKPKDISIGEVAMGIIRQRLTELDKEKKLTEQHIPIYEKFVLGGA